MRLLQHLKKDTTTAFLLGISIVFFLLRFPSLFEPYWYGDEGIYEVIGFGLRHGRALYSGIWDNKPPLLYIIYAFFNGDQGSVRLASLLVGIASVLFFFYLAKKLLRKPIAFGLTAAFALLFSLPILEANIANAENFMLLPTMIAGMYCFISALRIKEENMVKKNVLVVPGILLGIAFLIKVVAVFDFAAFSLFIFFATYKDFRFLKNQFFFLLPFVLGFFFPLFLTCLYFFATGNLHTFIQSAFASNVGYVGYGNKLIIPQGLLLLKLLLLGVFSLYLFVKRKIFSPSSLFILLWIAFSLFNMFFSQRPYTHYVLVALPSALLFVGFLKLESNKKIQRFFTAVGIIAFLVVFFSFSLYSNLHKKTILYYTNFISYLSQHKSTMSYYGFFDSNTPKDYVLAGFVNSHIRPGENLFIWGNNSQVYRLTNLLPYGRFLVAYHMTASTKNMQETIKNLSISKPTFIIVDPHLASSLPYSLTTYKMAFIYNNWIIYEKLF